MVGRSVVLILGCTIAGVLFGIVVGYLLGSLAPAFCFTILRSPDALNSGIGLQLGLGLGIANGAWIGLIAGVAIVIGEAIRSIKKT